MAKRYFSLKALDPGIYLCFLKFESWKFKINFKKLIWMVLCHQCKGISERMKGTWRDPEGEKGFAFHGFVFHGFVFPPGT